MIRSTANFLSDTLAVHRRTAAHSLVGRVTAPPPPASALSQFSGLPGASANLPPSAGSKHSRHLKEYLVAIALLEKNLGEQGELTRSQRRLAPD